MGLDRKEKVVGTVYDGTREDRLTSQVRTVLIR